MKNSVKNILFSVITYILWAMLVPPFLILCSLIACLPQSYRKNNRLYFFLTSTMSWLIIKATFVRISYIGKEYLPAYPNMPAIIIANHASALDIPILEIITKSYPRAWMSKEAYKNIPLVGFLLQRMHILVNKTTASTAHRALINMVNKIKDSPCHALIFPEGTRHADGAVHQFYSGFAILAQKLGRPVIPVIISGMHTVMPKKSFVIDSCDSIVTITIGKPIYCPIGTDLEHFTKGFETYFKQQSKTLDV